MSKADPFSLPKHLNASIGGFMGESYSVTLRDNTLDYTAYDTGYSNPRHLTLTPTAAQWREFRQTLDDIRIWQWNAAYHCDTAIDGTQWSLEIVYADHTIKTHGDNSYPGAAGKPSDSTSRTFDRYLAAIRKLTGGKIFE